MRKKRRDKNYRPKSATVMREKNQKKSQHSRAERPRARTLSHNKRTRNPKHGARDRTVDNGFTAETERDTGTAAALARVRSGPLVVPAGRQRAPRDGDGPPSAAAGGPLPGRGRRTRLRLPCDYPPPPPPPPHTVR